MQMRKMLRTPRRKKNSAGLLDSFNLFVITVDQGCETEKMTGFLFILNEAETINNDICISI